ncbi:hypothetical protein [Zophobihabitans entericus]|uniref:Uncharacterized protein n=1 Tax=Zophobihabitans entericus TaxID=1635327 RepID=A0A6G9ID11_9GAMM|nr:hypothetical protein [Zophobihabitans entericus]QIQ21470.1 hypothetical protein IPMB12_07100 [Zophobihabitans entericus]
MDNDNTHLIHFTNELSYSELTSAACLISKFYGVQGLAALKLELCCYNTKVKLEAGMNVIKEIIKHTQKHGLIVDSSEIEQMFNVLSDLIKGFDKAAQTVADESLKYRLETVKHIE